MLSRLLSDWSNHLLSCWHLLRHAGHGGRALPSHAVPLTDGEQGARQDGAEVVEGAPAGGVAVIAGGQQGSHWAREQLGQQRLIGVAVAAERPGHAQEGGHGIPAQVLCTRGKTRLLEAGGTT